MRRPERGRERDLYSFLFFGSPPFQLLQKIRETALNLSGSSCTFFEERGGEAQGGCPHGGTSGTSGTRIIDHYLKNSFDISPGEGKNQIYNLGNPGYLINIFFNAPNTRAGIKS